MFDGNREAQSLGHRDDRRVDADHKPARIHERAARIARIDRRRVLHDVLDKPAIAGSHAPARALTTPVDTVDCNPSGLPIAITSWPTRSASLSPSWAYGKPFAASRIDRQVGRRVVADEFGPKSVAFGRFGLQLRPVVDDVAIRDRVAIGRNDKSRSAAATAIRHRGS